MTYAEKLQDPRWQRKRLEIFQRDDFTCLVCCSNRRTLHVHHLAYSKEPWDTPAELLETLCVKCHEIREVFDDSFGKIKAPSLVVVRFLYLIGGEHISVTDKKSDLSQLIRKSLVDCWRKQNDSSDKNAKSDAHGIPASTEQNGALNIKPRETETEPCSREGAAQQAA